MIRVPLPDGCRWVSSRAKEISGGLDHDSAQGEEGDEVGDCHEPVHRLGYVPHEVELPDGTDGHEGKE